MNDTSAAISSGSPMRAILLAHEECLFAGGFELRREARGSHRTGIDGVHLNAIFECLYRTWLW